MVDVVAVRWESLGVVIGTLALGAWSLSGVESARENATERDRSGKLIVEVARPGADVETLEVEDGCLIGRGRDCVIALNDGSVSKWHARLHFDGRHAVFEDLNSTNGTLVNGRRIESGDSVQLRRGDHIGIGASHIVFVTVVPVSESRS